MSNENFALLKHIIPPLLPSYTKGQLGRIGIFGGSQEYTGAPYFAAAAAANLGSDLCFVICAESAASTIKSYSPDLIVLPYLTLPSTHASTTSVLSTSITHEIGATSTESLHSNCLPIATDDQLHPNLLDSLKRLHVIAIGPGLGRDPRILAACARVLKEARNANIPVVLDADGLQLAMMYPELVEGYNNCVFTPNIVEFHRLAKFKRINLPLNFITTTVKNSMSTDEMAKYTLDLAAAYGHVTIVAKGIIDHISNGHKDFNMICDRPGSLKRSGGQGDTLVGLITGFLAYRHAYITNLWPHNWQVTLDQAFILAAWGGCAFTRECSARAFAVKGRSMQASDLTGHIHDVLEELIGPDKSSLL